MTDAPHAIPALEADCARCFGLCCVALPFARSADFPVDKAGGDPCHNLLDDFRCRIHDSLEAEGWRGCITYDCLGAGQQVSQVTFGGVSWRDVPASATQMYAVLPVMRAVHESLRFVLEALSLEPGRNTASRLSEVRDQLAELTAAAADDLVGLDVQALRARVGPLLVAASASARERARRRHGIRGLDRAGRAAAATLAGTDLAGADLAGADLAGARLPGRDLRTADLRSALLIAADLRASDLRWADLLGADLRDADLRGARLEGAIFLTPAQLASARTV
ncbi:pentapeptide repeat-containing protein [Intrasporangium mesophilum]